MSDLTPYERNLPQWLPVGVPLLLTFRLAGTLPFEVLRQYQAEWCRQDVLQRTGPFWHREAYDPICRAAAETQRGVSYILQNPVKAGLVAEWQH